MSILWNFLNYNPIYSSVSYFLAFPIFVNIKLLFFFFNSEFMYLLIVFVLNMGSLDIFLILIPNLCIY
jgi:hypothetical protein